MKTRTKALLLALSAILLVVSTVFATMAFLTSTTDTVKNTFTVGKVTITLDEARVNVYGEPGKMVDQTFTKVDTVADADRVTANTYKLIPGHVYKKDPTIHVDPASEACWIFIEIENNISEIEKAGSTTIAAQMAANNWLLIDADSGVYVYNEIVDPAAVNDLDIEIFDAFTIAENAVLYDDNGAPKYDGELITITGYAIQADGFGLNYDNAWDAVKDTWDNNQNDQTPAAPNN